MKLRDKDKLNVVAGVNQLWWLPMSKVTIEPSICSGVSESNELRTSEVLRPIKIEGRTAKYSHKPERTEHGIAYNMVMECEHLILDKEKDTELMDINKERLLLFFKDNRGNYRYILGARLMADADTGYQGGKPAYALTFTRTHIIPSTYFTGNVNVESNGTLTIG